MGIKLIIDFKNCNNFADFYGMLTKSFDVLFADNIFYIWLGKHKKSSIEKILNDCEINNFVIFDIDDKSADIMQNQFVKNWLEEHFRDEYIKNFEKEHQKDMQEMQNNINRANELIKNRIKNNI